jgi:biotin carboxyl carrier protein
MLQVNTPNGKQWQVDVAKSEILVDNNAFAWDISVIRPGFFHIIKDNVSYSAEVISADIAQKTFEIKINGRHHFLTLKDRFDLLLDKMGMSQANVKAINEIKAPMPGLIVAIKVVPGQEVKKGEPLLILEAMKMENILKSPGDGQVRSIPVNLRDNVEKNQVLILFH